jgi:hypothetical protein
METKAPVAIKRAPTVDVQLAGENYATVTYKLAYDWHSIITVKTMTGKSPLSSEYWSTLDDDPALISAILFAGLNLYQPELTYDDACGMLLPSQLGTVLPKIREAWLAVQPPVDPKIDPLTVPPSDL